MTYLKDRAARALYSSIRSMNVDEQLNAVQPLAASTGQDPQLIVDSIHTMADTELLIMCGEIIDLFVLHPGTK